MHDLVAKKLTPTVGVSFLATRSGSENGPPGSRKFRQVLHLRLTWKRTPHTQRKRRLPHMYGFRLGSSILWRVRELLPFHLAQTVLHLTRLPDVSPGRCDCEQRRSTRNSNGCTHKCESTGEGERATQGEAAHPHAQPLRPFVPEASSKAQS